MTRYSLVQHLVMFGNIRFVACFSFSFSISSYVPVYSQVKIDLDRLVDFYNEQIDESNGKVLVVNPKLALTNCISSIISGFSDYSI